MKTHLRNSVAILIILLNCHGIKAQTPEEHAVIATINSFFDAFHAQDSTAMNSFVSEGIVMQTIARNEDGKAYVKTNSFSEFVKGITRIPDSVAFKEKLLSFEVKIDGPMASAWTPYEFWVNGKFSHCGVNAFQCFREGEVWKIIYIIDTRRREACPGK